MPGVSHYDGNNAVVDCGTSLHNKTAPLNQPDNRADHTMRDVYGVYHAPVSVNYDIDHTLCELR